MFPSEVESTTCNPVCALLNSTPSLELEKKSTVKDITSKFLSWKEQFSLIAELDLRPLNARLEVKTYKW